MNENRSLRPRFPLFHVPHDGSLHRSRIQMFCIPEEKILYYHEKMRDKYVAELIPHEYRRGDHSVSFPFSRLQCDTERLKGPGRQGTVLCLLLYSSGGGWRLAVSDVKY